MTVGTSFRIFVAVALTAFVLWQSDPAAVTRAAAGTDWRFIVLALGLVVVDRALMAYRWLVLLCPLPDAERPPLRALLRIFFVSTFVGTFLPTSVGGDVVRAYSLARQNVGGGTAVASVFMDRMLGVLSILVLGVVGTIAARHLVADGVMLWALGLTAAACGGTALLVWSRRAAGLAQAMINRLPGARIRDGSRSLLDAVRRYAGYRRQLLNVLLGSVAVQVLRVFQAYYLGRAMGITAPLAVYLAFIPLILLIMLLPVTVYGLGTSQAAFVWFFARAGVTRPDAFALSVLFVALGLVGNLPGGILYATGGAGARGMRKSEDQSGSA